MSFFAELKQRKVIRVAAAYLALSWVATEVASVVLPTFDAPLWVLRVLILLLALGFPLVLLLSWALEVTPGGIKKTRGEFGNKRMAAIAAGFLALALAWYFVGQPAYRHEQAQSQPTERSIAVLPFVNMSGDKSNDYFSDGLAETTLDMLAQVKDLKVIARTSSFAFKGKASDVREIGKALGAAHLLEGSVQQAGDTVRITAQLVRTSDGSHLWSRRFDRKLADVFQIQDEIAMEVVRALQVALPAAEQQQLVRKRTDSVAAYREYLKGNALLPGRKVADMRQAVVHFQRAIELDPGYARAYAAAAITLELLQSYANLSPAEAALRKHYVERALALAPGLGEAHIAQASMLGRARDISGAERAYRRGTELAPGYANGFMWYGEFLLHAKGDIASALRMYDRALSLDPLSQIVRNEHAYVQAIAGRTDEALSENTALLAEHPEFAGAYGLRANLLEARGDLVGALRARQAQEAHDPEAVTRQLSRCYTLARFGALAEADDCGADYARRYPDKPETLKWQVFLLVLHDEPAQALAAYQRSTDPDPWDQSMLLLNNGRFDQALPLLQELVPELFEQPPQFVSAFPGDAVVVGSTLLRTGAAARGRAVLQGGLQASASHPHAQILFGRGWWDVGALAELDDIPGACRALKEAVDSDYFLDIPQLDVDPFAVEVRKDPCYQRTLAPARRKAAAQVEAAREAGLL